MPWALVAWIAFSAKALWFEIRVQGFLGDIARQLFHIAGLAIVGMSFRGRLTHAQVCWYWVVTSTYVLVLGILKSISWNPGSTCVLWFGMPTLGGGGARDMSKRGDHVIHV